VSEFRYLGRWLTDSDHDSTAIVANIKKANGTLAAAMKRVTRKRCKPETRLHVVQAVIMTQLLYGAETWKPTTTDADRLRKFHRRALRWATGLHPTVTTVDGQRVIRFPRNEEVMESAHTDDIMDIIAHRQLRFYGHVLRYADGDPVRQVLHRTMGGPGRPGFTNAQLLSTRIEDLMARAGLEERDARNRSYWRRTVATLLPVRWPPKTEVRNGPSG
jgi:hypothetical protein